MLSNPWFWVSAFLAVALGSCCVVLYWLRQGARFWSEAAQDWERIATDYESLVEDWKGLCETLDEDRERWRSLAVSYGRKVVKHEMNVH